MLAAPLPLNEAARLAALRSYEVLDTACEEAFDNIARLAAKLIGSEIALVSLVDANRQWFKARVGIDAAETPRGLAFCAHAILNPAAPLVVPDATKDARFADNALVQTYPDVRAYTGVPLVNPEGLPLGTLCVIDRKPRDPSTETLGMLVSLARTVETTLELL